MPPNLDQFDDKAYAQVALKIIRSLCRGNGIAQDSIQIKELGGEIIQCEAISHIEIEQEVTSEKKIGAHQVGELCADPAQMEQAVQKHQDAAMKNNDMRKFMANTLLERDDKGFSLHAEYFDVKPLDKSYCLHQPCGTCHGQARSECPKCRGKCKENCSRCHGNGMEQCMHCRGTGFNRDPKRGDQVQCHYCRGKKRTACRVCQKRGHIICQQCKGAGHVPCAPCKSTGVITHIMHATAKIKTLFEIDRAALPHPVVKVIEDQGDKMVARGHIDLRSEQVKREDGGLAIQYHAKFPYGDLIMSLNGKPVKMHIFGYKGKLVKVPNFLEDLIAPQLIQLQGAAKGSGNVMAQIRKASKSRLIGNALLFSLNMPAKKAMVGLKKKFPMGVSNERLKELVQMSKKSLNNLTAKARYMGLTLAGLFNAALNWFYFTGGVRAPIAEAISLNGLMVVDFVTVPLGGFVGSLITGFMAKRPLQQALGHLTSKISAKKLIIWPNYALSAAIFVGVFPVMKVAGYALPHWLPLYN